MKKEAKTQKMTLDKLAIMMNNGFEKLEERLDGKLDKKINEVKEEIKGVKNQLEGTNKRIDALAMNKISYEEHNKLKVRVDILEKKA